MTIRDDSPNLRLRRRQFVRRRRSRLFPPVLTTMKLLPGNCLPTPITAILVLLLAAGNALPQSPAPKPRVPAGLDPGGTAVAVIGGGVDYTRAGMASRLARDGEGEIIGWDFVDRDNRPFDRCVLTSPDIDLCPTALAEVVLNPNSNIRLVVARVDGTRPPSIVEAIQMVANTPARIVFLAIEPPTYATLLREAARLNAATLFIAIGDTPDPSMAISSEWPENIVFTDTGRGGAVLAARAAALKARSPALDPAGLRAALTTVPIQR